MRREPVENRICRKIEILAKTAPQRRRHADRCVAVAKNRSARKFIGLIAKTVFADATPAAIFARQILFDGDAIPFFDAPALCCRAAYFGDKSDIFVSLD